MNEPKLIERPWQPQDLLDDLQLMIDEQPNRYLNANRATLCEAKAYLEEHFAEPKWISVEDRLPELFESVLVYLPNNEPWPTVREGYIANDGVWYVAFCGREPGDVTHWMPLPEPPKED